MTQERKLVESAKERLYDEIQQLKTEMDKNKDQLVQYEDHKTFLMHIYEEYCSEWYQEFKEDKEDRENMLREEFIEAMLQTDPAYTSQMKGMRKTMSVAPKNAKLLAGDPRREEAVKKFNYLLSEDLIDVPPGFYEEELYTEDENFIYDIFAGLMDKNLAIINKMQGSQETLELKRHEYTSLKTDQEKKIAILEETAARHREDLEINRARLAVLQKQAEMQEALKEDGHEVSRMGKKDADDDDEPNIHKLMAEMEDAVHRAHTIMDGSQPLEGKDSMDLLQEIEVSLIEWRKTIYSVYEEEKKRGVLDANSVVLQQEDRRKKENIDETIAQKRQAVEQEKQ